MSTEGNLRFKIDWANLLVGSNFTVFALFYFVFEGNFPREAYIWTTSSPGRSSLALEVGRPHLQRPRKSALGTRLIFGGRFNGGRWADGQMGFLRYRFWRLIFGGAYFRNLTVLSKSGAASVQVYPLLSLHYTFSYFYDPHEETLLSSILPLTARAKIEPDVSKDARGCARSSWTRSTGTRYIKWRSDHEKGVVSSSRKFQLSHLFTTTASPTQQNGQNKRNFTCHYIFVFSWRYFGYLPKFDLLGLETHTSVTRF